MFIAKPGTKSVTMQQKKCGMRSGYTLVLLLLLLTSTGCDSDKQWVERKFYENGILKSEVEMKGDEADGVGRFYFPSGKLQMVTEYRNDKRHGWSHSYYESGQKKLESKFVDGRPGSSSIYFSADGDTLAFYNDGRAIRFFENGKIEQITCSTNNDLNSIRSIRFDGDGKIIKREEPLYCLTSRDSLLLDKQYPNWKTGAVVKADTK